MLVLDHLLAGRDADADVLGDGQPRPASHMSTAVYVGPSLSSYSTLKALGHVNVDFLHKQVVDGGGRVDFSTLSSVQNEVRSKTCAHKGLSRTQAWIVARAGLCNGLDLSTYHEDEAEPQQFCSCRCRRVVNGEGWLREDVRSHCRCPYPPCSQPEQINFGLVLGDIRNQCMAGFPVSIRSFSMTGLSFGECIFPLFPFTQNSTSSHHTSFPLLLIPWRDVLKMEGLVGGRHPSPCPSSPLQVSQKAPKCIGWEEGKILFVHGLLRAQEHVVVPVADSNSLGSPCPTLAGGTQLSLPVSCVGKVCRGGVKNKMCWKNV